MLTNSEKRALHVIADWMRYSITNPYVSALEHDFGFKPSTSLRDGLRAFAQWYKEFYKV